MKLGDALGFGEAANAGRIVVPDANLLFSGDFKRSGLDLELSHDDRHFLVRDYFRGEHRAALSSSDGAWLTGDVVSALTGHTQFAQADGLAGAGKIIGHVTKLAGSATVIRNGVSIILNLGDNVEKGDVVQSGSDSKLGITFIDGTVFGLASNSRMVLNEMIYDPNGSNNSSLLSLVAGTITFVAGQTAKHGDMKVDTPVATMGIRGTAVLVQKIEFLVSQNAQSGGPAQVTGGFQVLVEPDGTTGSYVLMDRITLNPIATVNDAGRIVTYNQGVFGTSAAAPLSAEIQQLITDVFALKFTDTNPKTLNQFTDSIVPDGIPHAVFASDDGNPSKYSVGFGQGAVTATATFEVITSQVHYDAPPIVNATSGEFTVRSGAVHRGGIDAVSGVITFDDVNRGDVPTVKTKFASFKVLDAQGNDITSSLTAKELAAIAAVEVGLTVVASPGNGSAGSATWTYSVADRAFDFLGAGRKLVLTYQAQVDTNYVGYNTTVLQPFTITISSPHAVEWIHPSDGLWSVGSNWKTGLVPTALDDAIIPAQDIVGGTGHYAVTIAEAAFANSVTLDAADTTGAQLINNSTLTVSNALTLFNESAFYNFGTTNAGLIELVNQSSLHNSGLIKLTEGGDFIDQSSVSNDEAGILELAGGTLNVAVNVANAGLVLIDPAANLTLHGASINGSIENKGTIDLTGLAALINGTLDNFGHVNVSGAGNALHDEMVSNFGAIVVTGELTLDLGTTITGGVVSNAGTVRVESEQGATLDNVDVENLAGAIQVGSTPAATVLVVEDGTVINGGTLSTGSAGTFEVAGASIATLGGVSVFNSGYVQVDEGSTLNLLGSTISGGFITDNGIIDVSGDSAINNAALNGGQVTVDATRTLTLDGTTVTGTTIIDDGTIKVGSGKTLNLSGVFLSGGLIINLGLIDIKGDSSISDDTINNSQLTIDDGTTLTLNGTIILGGIVTDDGIIHVTGDSAINNAAIYGGQIIVDDGYTLTLNGTTVTNTVIHDDGFIQIDVDKTRLLDGVAINGGTINNFGLLEIIGDSSISNDLLNNHQLTIDTGKTLTLSGATITGGIISDNGAIHVIGNSAINGNAELNGGLVTVDASTQLTLDNVTVRGTAIVDNGTVTVDAGSALDLSGVTLSGGAIDNLGLIDIVGDSSITNDTLTNANTLSVINNSILELTNTAVANLGGVVTVAAGSTLDLDSGASITDGALGNSGEVNAEGTTALHHLGITNSGTLESTGGVLTIDAGSSISNTGTLQANGGELDLTNDTVTNSNALKAINNSILELTNTAVANLGGVVTVAAGSTLDLDSGASITDGALGNSGEVNAEGTTALHHLGITNSGTLESTGGVLTIDAGSSISNTGTLQANGGELDLTNDTVTNSNALKAINNSILELTNTAVANLGGVVTVAAGSTLDLDSGASITDGALGNSGEVNAEGTTALHHLGITNSGTLESTGGVLTIDAGSSISNTGTLQANGGELDLTNDTVTNSNALKAINNSILELTNTAVANLGGVVTVAAGSTLDLDSGASITDGALGNSGEVNAEGTTALHHLGITNSGTLESTGGVLTIDAGSSISNTGTLQANGGELDLTNDTVTNSNALKAINNSILELTNTAVANLGGVVTVAAGSTLDLDSGASITDGALGNSGEVNAEGTTALHHLGITNSGTLESTGGVLTIDAGSSISNTGTLQANGGELDLTNDTVTNSNALKAINNSILELTNTAVANLGGVVTVAAGSTLDLDSGASITDGTLGNSGEVNAEGTTALHHLGITNSGTLESTGGVLTIDAGSSISNTGTLQANGGELDLTNDTVTNSNALKAINNSILELTGTTVINTGGTVTVGTGSTLDLDTSTITSGLVTISTNGSIDLNGLAVLANGSLSNSGHLSVNGTGNELYHETVTANHLLEIMAGGALLIDQGSTIANSGGTVQVDVGGTLTLNSASLSPAIIDGGTVADYGTIYVINTVDISGNIIGTGAINIANLAELEIGGSVASGNTVLFTGVQGELILDQSNQFFGLITGSSVGTLLTLDDQIDLRDLSFNSNHMSTTVSYSSNVSTVTFIDHTDAGDISVQIRLSGDYTNQGWLFTNDGYGGSLVQLAPPPVFSDIIDNRYAFTGHKTAAGTSWTFQAAVTDDDATTVGQGGITKFDLYDNGTLFGSATFNGSAWTVSGSLMSVSYADGIYTITSNTTAIKNGDLLEITAYDAANLSASKSVTLKNESSFQVAPAGIAGEPINLALTDPSGGQLTGPVHLTLTGVPSDWSISEGTNLGNGTWTVETNDLTALTVTTAAAYTGAMVLSVTETWTNADGSTGAAVVLDNVEAYATGSPIFALSGDDTLTGAVGNDLFVFAQPIGHDTVYSFDTGHDQIDLIGYAGFTSFADVQAHLTEDANGNALITLGDGQSIELQGVHAAALTQTDFVFDQVPTLDNAGTMTISDGAVMPLSGTINNSGTIALNSTGDETDLQLIEHGVTLQGGGQIVLSDSAANIISGTSSGVTLDNEDNTISGAGQLGNGELTLTNAGTIDATGTHALTIDTGANSVINSGILEASGGGGLTVASSIVNSGVLWANGSTLTVQGQVSGNGTAVIDGTATLDLEASATVNVTFGSGAGTLKLGDSFHFNGTIAGFGGADVIDLAHVEFGTASLSYHENVGGTGGTLTISDGVHISELSLVGNYSADNFSLAPDLIKGTAITYLAHDLVV
ncbi:MULTISPECIES: FecR domain-containing protein [unclassified Bradyrhizobium]|uniref:FecR domain-containing protein n=1 Tax=unclassified Bradyrhizobium TaxID=2631580 RepID=UPI00143DA663|nr:MULTISPECIES: FecR domain-containing protein [unclassified Bradyrhizobium]